MVYIVEDSQPLYIPPPLDDVPDVEQDKPVEGQSLSLIRADRLPAVIFGAGTLGHLYNEDGFLNSDGPLRAVRLALRYGICGFDTSPYYGSSEVILGTILRILGAEFPRTSYRIASSWITKAGRYGNEREAFDYSPTTVRASVLRSLQRLGTDHLDAVYMHDVEFVATAIKEGSTVGDHLEALQKPESWGLETGSEGQIRGEGDQQVLDAVRELFKMKEEGMIRAVGISGYPLPTLLRIALLVLHNPPYKPLDILLSYSHYTLQNNTFSSFVPYFLHRAKVSQLVNASPFSMGLLTPNPPVWHPAPPGMMAAKNHAASLVQDWEGGLVDLALGFSMRQDKETEDIPCVVGFSTMREVHEAVKVWRAVQHDDNEERKEKEDVVKQVFKEGGWEGLSWQSPPLP